MTKPKPSPQALSRETWMAALHEIASAPIPDEHPDAVTTVEFAAMLGVGREMAYRKLHALVAAGKAERVRKKQRASDGGVRPVDAYRLLRASDGKRP